MDTLDQLKQAAREREEARDAKILAEHEAAARENAQRNASLLEFVRTTEPFSVLAANARMTTSNDQGRDVAVSFEIPGYAEIAARFQWFEGLHDLHPAGWFHVGFNNSGGGYRYMPDPERMWGVSAFDRIQQDWVDDDHHEYIPRYTESHFAELGDALLAAERAFVEPARITEQLRQYRERELAKTAAAPVVIPKPSVGQVLLGALEDFIRETSAVPEF